jgi:hypothetical protein
MTRIYSPTLLHYLVMEGLSESDALPFAALGITWPLVDLIGCTATWWRQTNEGDMTMSNVTKIALSAAIILGTAFSALAAGKAQVGASREQAAGTPALAGTIAAYGRDGGIVPLRDPGQRG